MRGVVEATRRMPATRECHFEDAMPIKQNDRIVETPTEARSAEPGPSVLALLTVSTIAAGFTLAIIWFLFFRT